MNDDNERAANNEPVRPEPTRPEPVPPPTLTGTIQALLGAIPTSELRLRGQLVGVLEILSEPAAAGSDGDVEAVERAAWRRAMQLFGNRVYELRTAQIGVRVSAMPEWVAAGTAIIDAYVPEERAG